MANKSSKILKHVLSGDFIYNVEIIPDEDGGYVAEVPGLQGCLTQGDTLKEVQKNAKDAIECWLDARNYLAKSGVHVRVNSRQFRKRAGNQRTHR